MADKPFPLLVSGFEERQPLGLDLELELKRGDAAAKARAMKRAIVLLINGGGGGDTTLEDDLPGIILSYVLPCEDVTVQMLVLLYLEILYKGGKRLPADATILVGAQLRRNLLQHNERICGATLRLIRRLNDPDLLEPVLVDFVFTNIYNRNRSVRRHAYSTFLSLYRLPQPKEADYGGEMLFPGDALDLVEHQLNIEKDAVALRNAFIMVCTCARRQAVAYLLANADRAVAEWPGVVQVVAINLIRAVVCDDGAEEEGDTTTRSKLFGILMSLVCSSSSNSVIYEGADALLSLHSSEPQAVRAAANAYVELLLSTQTDEDVRRIVMARLVELTLQQHSSTANINGEPSGASSDPHKHRPPSVSDHTLAAHQAVDHHHHIS